VFCSNCGARAGGNFCAACGARLTAVPTGATPPPLPVEQPSEPLPHDWHDEVRYSVLMHFPEVRDRIAHHAGLARKKMTGEQFIELYDKLLGSITHGSLSTVVSIAKPLSSWLGIKTGKNRTELLTLPVGKVIVAGLCSLARHGWEMQKVHQGEDGCVLEATLPSDLWSLAGEVIVSVKRCDLGTVVEAAAKISGQKYDWGKCQKCLDELFADLLTLADQPSSSVRKAA
jgi:hypothetical protein